MLIFLSREHPYGQTSTVQYCTAKHHLGALVGGKSKDGSDLIMLEYGIVWQSDVSYKYKQAEGFVDQRCSFCN